MAEYLEDPCTDCDDTLPGGGIGNGKCSNCSGTGVEPLTPDLECEKCGGNCDCPTCNGTGYA